MSDETTGDLPAGWRWDGEAFRILVRDAPEPEPRRAFGWWLLAAVAGSAFVLGAVTCGWFIVRVVC